MNNTAPDRGLTSDPASSPRAALNKGLLFALVTFFLWGSLPLYWKFLGGINSLHILAARILVSLVLLITILSFQKNFAWLSIFKDIKKTRSLIAASLILCFNWGLYIWAVNQGRIVEASLGYYINPLVSVVLGLIFFREKLKTLQWAAVILAFLGVLILTILSGTPPWISLILALTFGFYGLVKKQLKLSSLESLTAETLVVTPLGVLFLLVKIETQGGLRFIPDAQNLAYFAELGVGIWIALALIGVVSSLPLYCFGRAAKLLPLSTVGFCQFIAPTLQFSIGVFIYGEAFPLRNAIAFSFIWFAVILYIISLKKRSPA